ncbi:hypothetical protein [Flavobacterium sp.]
MKIYSKKNFHKHTFCLWQEVTFDTIKNLEKDHKSKSGSGYIFVENGVYRVSNHWGRVANCRWRLLGAKNYRNQDTKVAFAAWKDFYPNDEISKSFFIKVDFEINEVFFFHTHSAQFDAKDILRNADDTFKIIKVIKELLTETGWSKHLIFDNIVTLRAEIVTKLVTTDTSFAEIKKLYF